MFTGHLAAGLAIKTRYPKVPALPIMFGSALLDILNGLFIISGFDQVNPDLTSGPYLYFDLAWIDWDHSLAMAIFWAVIWGAVFMKDRKTALVASSAVLLHFVMDLPVHNQDLALFPHSRIHLGLGLWGALGVYAWLLEGLLAAILMAYAWRQATIESANLKWSMLLLAGLHLQLSPRLSPMQLVARLPEPYVHILMGSFTALGFAVPALLIVWQLNRPACLPK